ncbi:hypothetical protein Holit_01324 [Hollandina sp. SP2]
MTPVYGPLFRVEQKNNTVVRQYIGYDRLEGDVLQAGLAQVYRILVPLRNFFMSAMKLNSKVKVGTGSTRPASHCGRPLLLSPLLRGGNRWPKVTFF